MYTKFVQLHVPFKNITFITWFKSHTCMGNHCDS